MEINEKIKSMPYFSRASLASALGKINPRTLNSFLRYRQEKGSLFKIKRGIYVFKKFVESGDNILYYSRFLATKMIEPSYLSKEFILQDYQILTDVVFNYSVITAKKTAVVINKFGTFNYQSIKPELFQGFKKKSYGDMIWYEASKSKALFDFLYFNQKKFVEFSKKELDELRLNLELIGEKDWREFELYLKFASKKMRFIYQLIKKCAS